MADDFVRRLARAHAEEDMRAIFQKLRAERDRMDAAPIPEFYGGPAQVAEFKANIAEAWERYEAKRAAGKLTTYPFPAALTAFQSRPVAPVSGRPA